MTTPEGPGLTAEAMDLLERLMALNSRSFPLATAKDLAALAPTVAASEATEVHGREKAAIEREAGVTADRVYVAYLAPSPATEAERRGGEE